MIDRVVHPRRRTRLAKAFFGIALAAAVPAIAEDVPSNAPGTSPSASGFTIDPYVHKTTPLLENPYTTMPETMPMTATSVQQEFSLRPPASPATTSPATVPVTGESARPKHGEFLAVPIPSHKPTFGWGVNVMLGYVFPLDPDDKISPPSTVGGFGFYSENQSWATGLFGQLYLKEDHYRVRGGIFAGDINYDFSGIGTAAGESGLSIPLEQSMRAGAIEVLALVGPKLYLGPRYIYSDINTTVDLSQINNLPVPPEAQLESTMSAIGIHLQWDTRDSQFYPRKGGLLDLSGDFHNETWGDDFDYQIYRLSYNRYISITDKQVLALRGASQFCEGDVPFYSLAAFGQGADLRGYTYGQFQDETLVAVQAEYRIELTRRIGIVGFAGVGEVGPNLGQYTFDNLLPSVGVGLRFVLAEENHISLRLDGAWGREGGEFYLAVGEAF